MLRVKCFSAPQPHSNPASTLTNSSATLHRRVTSSQRLTVHRSDLSSCQSSSWLGFSLSKLRAYSRPRCSRNKAVVFPTLALVNIDFNPSLLLGMGLVGGGLTITSLRSVKPIVSRDLDIVIACVAWMSGGILIFQVSCCNMLFISPSSNKILKLRLVLGLLCASEQKGFIGVDQPVGPRYPGVHMSQRKHGLAIAFDRSCKTAILKNHSCMLQAHLHKCAVLCDLKHEMVCWRGLLPNL